MVSSARLTSRARATLRRSFAVQYSVFELGLRRLHFGQRCQKHPSTKIAMRFAAKTKSGLPGNDATCIFHPLIRSRISADRTRHSVDLLPRERTLPIRLL